jgi:signal transduction histidine kinase
MHEIKTKLTVIMGTAQVLERRIRLGRDVSPEQMLTMLIRIRRQAELAHDLVHSLRSSYQERTPSSSEQ